MREINYIFLYIPFFAYYGTFGTEEEEEKKGEEREKRTVSIYTKCFFLFHTLIIFHCLYCSFLLTTSQERFVGHFEMRTNKQTNRKMVKGNLKIDCIDLWKQNILKCLTNRSIIIRKDQPRNIALKLSGELYSLLYFAGGKFWFFFLTGLRIIGYFLLHTFYLFSKAAQCFHVIALSEIL